MGIKRTTSILEKFFQSKGDLLINLVRVTELPSRVHTVLKTTLGTTQTLLLVPQSLISNTRLPFHNEQVFFVSYSIFHYRLCYIFLPCTHIFK